MATGASPLTPPPGASANPEPMAPTNPTAVSPSPEQPSPVMQHGTQLVIGAVQNLRAISKAYPSTTPEIGKINDLMRTVLAKMMQHQNPGEPAAPPVG